MRTLALWSGILLLAVALAMGLAFWEPGSADRQMKMVSLLTGFAAVFLIKYGRRREERTRR